MHHASPQPPPCEGCIVAFPEEHIMLVTIDRPRTLNAMTQVMHWHLDRLLNWFDDEPSLRVAVITGQGDRAFCAGSNLLGIEAGQMTKMKEPEKDRPWERAYPPSGFAGISRRRGKKPVLAAVNGLALGGGFEIVLNCDVVIASPKAQFSLPEPSVGVYAWGGGLPRLVRAVGLQAASDIALTGRRVSAKEALDLHLISSISSSPDTVVAETLEKAKQIASISPDGIIVTRAGLREAWETGSVERAFQITHEQWYERLLQSENSVEGLAAFREKRKPVWKGSKL